MVLYEFSTIHFSVFLIIDIYEVGSSVNFSMGYSQNWTFRVLGSKYL